MSGRKHCSSSSRITAAAMLSWLAISLPFAVGQQQQYQQPLNPVLPVLPPSDISQPAFPSEHEFTLRHVFHRGTSQFPSLHRRLDISVDTAAQRHSDEASGVWSDIGPFTARSSGLEIQRLVDRNTERIVDMEERGRTWGYKPVLPDDHWTIDTVQGPNVTDKETVLTLARMAAVAYNQGPDDPEWMDVGKPFNKSADFGWQGDGLRGHVYADKTNSTIVISIKGTSKAVFDGAETTTGDKINDNLFFGCCCGEGGGSLVRKACDCATDTYTCNNTCVRQELVQPNRYWRASIDLYDNVTALYPKTENIWLVGHSLGGSVAALLGLTVGEPAVGFEAPGEALAASRLGLPLPPGHNETSKPQHRQLTGAYHFGHNADPVFTGTCNGFFASCVLGGYALETQCHTGMVCEYDTIGDGWRSSMLNHGIRSCIANVYELYPELPKCVSDADCESDCINWKYFESNGSDITTTRTTTTTATSMTRTETCKTPGWWGCLDESTTASFTTTVTETLTTTTCTKYGWFGGCVDLITTTETLTTTVAYASEPHTTSVETTTTTSSSSSSASTTVTCTSYGWFGRCLDSSAASATSSPTSTTAPAPMMKGAIHPAGSRVTKPPSLDLELR